MASITLTIPNSEAARVLDGFAAYHRYRVTIDNPDYDPNVEGSLVTIPNPETKIQFAKKKIIEFIKESVSAAEERATLEAARDAAPAEPDIT